MQPTGASMWRGWDPVSLSEGPRVHTMARESVAKLREQLRDLSLGIRLAFSNTNFKVYTGNEERQLISLQAALRKASQSRKPTSPPDWVHHLYPWQLPDLANVHLRGVSGGPRDEAPPLAAAPSFWEGLLLGALLLALLVLLLRAADHCLHRAALKRQITRASNTRRPSEEWQTPVVLATSHTHQCPEASPDPAAEPEAPPDLPPSYSQCSEPPPSYSACYLAYPPKGPAEGVLASNTDTGQPEVQLVFENGRVLERPETAKPELRQEFIA